MKVITRTISKMGAKFFCKAARVAAQAPCWGPHYQSKTPKQLESKYWNQF